MPWYQFGSLPFLPRQSDNVPAVDPGDLIFGERHVPYSDINIIDIGGRAPRRYKCTIRVNPDQVTAWEASQGVTASLWVMDQEYTSATLVKLTNHQRTPLNVEPVYHFYDAEWAIGRPT